MISLEEVEEKIIAEIERGANMSIYPSWTDHHVLLYLRILTRIFNNNSELYFQLLDRWLNSESELFNYRHAVEEIKRLQIERYYSRLKDTYEKELREAKNRYQRKNIHESYKGWV